LRVVDPHSDHVVAGLQVGADVYRIDVNVNVYSAHRTVDTPRLAIALPVGADERSVHVEPHRIIALNRDTRHLRDIGDVEVDPVESVVSGQRKRTGIRQYYG
jgi:hypothetical protein